jgi:hypothetical protein
MGHLTHTASGLSEADYATLAELSTPGKIQTFLNELPMNFEKKGETCLSPRAVLREKKALCIEGAMLAATALWIHGEPPLIMDLSARLGRGDVDHVVAIFRRGGHYGAISKTNHPVLRFRDPIYRTPRELALSYFHEWFLYTTGEKTLECYSRPFNLKRHFGTAWINGEGSVWEVVDALAALKHYPLVPEGHWHDIRPVDAIELKAGALAEWPEPHAHPHP